MNERNRKMSPRGKRRAVAVRAAEMIIDAAALLAMGYAACLCVHGLQILLGVA